MARISVEDCLDQIPNRFVVVMLAVRRMRQLRKGSEPLVECKNGAAVTALREIAACKVTLARPEQVPGLNMPGRPETKAPVALPRRTRTPRARPKAG